MRLVVYCRECKKIIPVKKLVSDRGGFRMQYGDSIKLACKKCTYKGKYDVNNIKAKQGYLSILAAIALLPSIIFIICKLWAYSWKGGGSIYLIPVALMALAFIYSTYLFSETTNIRNFNRS